MNYHCANFYANILTNVKTTDIFPFLAIFPHIFYYFIPQKWQFVDLLSFAS